jgi:hypothetical protein
MYNKILNAKFKGDKYFVDEEETQLREKPLQGSQTQDPLFRRQSKLQSNNTHILLMQWSYLEL